MPHHILVVDDTADLCTLLVELLELEGYRVTSAANGQAALTRMVHDCPDLILLDLQMPVMSGWELHQRLQEIAPGLPVTFMSAGYRVQAEAARHGAAGYLAKPFDLDTVVTTVRRTLARRPA
jgi:two-component system response regulator (stage 0 sporulation protein F)